MILIKRYQYSTGYTTINDTNDAKWTLDGNTVSNDCGKEMVSSGMFNHIGMRKHGMSNVIIYSDKPVDHKGCHHGEKRLI